jgi:hypothetical protein
MSSLTARLAAITELPIKGRLNAMTLRSFMVIQSEKSMNE